MSLQFEFGNNTPWLISDPSLLRNLYIPPSERAQLQAALCETDPKKLVWGHPERNGRVATIPIHGVLTARPTWWRLFGIGGWSLSEIELAAYQLRSDQTVDSVLLDISSPGGEALPMAGVGQAIADLAEEKRVVAFVRDIGASAAYWLASQANEIVVGGTAETGSIGTVAVVWDWSKALSEEGIKTHVVSSGGHKGAFAFGSEVSDDQLAELQRVVDSLTNRFVTAVADGRGMNEAAARKLADGRTHIGSDAVDLKLVDRVGTTREVLEQLEAGMPEEPENPTVDDGTEGTPDAATEGRPAEASSNPQPPASAEQVQTLEERLAAAENRQAAIDHENRVRALDARLDSLGTRVTPGMRRGGLVNALAAIEDVTVTLDGNEMSAAEVVMSAFAAIPAADHLGTVLADQDAADITAGAQGIDADRVAQLKASYPGTFTQGVH